MRIALVWIVLLGACGGDDGHVPVVADAPKLDAPIDAPAVAPDPCDTVAQDCPTGQKCSLSTTPGHGVGRHCTAVTGHVAVGGTCTRTGFVDDCDVGMACADDRTCRPLCTATGGCTGGDNCTQFETQGDGLCFAPCTSTFDVGSCPAGKTCDAALHIGGNPQAVTWCRTIGPQQVGDPCPPQDPRECAAQLTCFATCSALCDATHPCTGTLTCHFAPGVADGECF